MVQSQFQGGTGVNFSYTGSSGSASAGPFSVTPLNPAGPAFDAYCVSLNIQVGSGPDTLRVSAIQALNSVGQAFFINSQYADVGNRLAFLLSSYGGGNSDGKQALALAVWRTIDKNFSYTGGTTAVNTLYAQYIQFTGTIRATCTPPGAKLLVVDQAYAPYQNLIGITSVPEPTSLVLAGSGLGGLGLLAARRVRKSRKYPGRGAPAPGGRSRIPSASSRGIGRIDIPGGCPGMPRSA
ncbi:MAG: hypothetical protein U0790_00790 [Isosphaeraceae bacterium]